MKFMATAAVSLVAAGLALGGCAHDVTTLGAQRVRAIDSARVHGPYVPAGTMVSVRMNDAIDTQRSPQGQPFTATVETALRGPDGTVVVPMGSVVRGAVVSTGDPSAPRLRLRLDTIDTQTGQAPLQATVRHAQRSAYAGPPQLVPTGVGPYHEDSVYPYDGMGVGFYGAAGGGPPGFDYTVQNTREIRLPRGARVELQLTREVIPPGTSVSP